MRPGAAIPLLLLAATLEAGGDALMRAGLHRQSIVARVGLMTCGAIALFAYGWTVNAPPWDFGRLLGVYVCFFFLIAQLISWFIFKQTPSAWLALGGLLIISGGIVIALRS